MKFDKGGDSTVFSHAQLYHLMINNSNAVLAALDWNKALAYENPGQTRDRPGSVPGFGAG